jgi:hypothetical protein
MYLRYFSLPMAFIAPLRFASPMSSVGTRGIPLLYELLGKRILIKKFLFAEQKREGFYYDRDVASM